VFTHGHGLFLSVHNTMIALVLDYSGIFGLKKWRLLTVSKIHIERFLFSGTKAGVFSRVFMDGGDTIIVLLIAGVGWPGVNMCVCCSCIMSVKWCWSFRLGCVSSGCGCGCIRDDQDNG
jgi:hypothetical protein